MRTNFGSRKQHLQDDAIAAIEQKHLNGEEDRTEHGLCVMHVDFTMRSLRAKWESTKQLPSQDQIFDRRIWINELKGGIQQHIFLFNQLASSGIIERIRRT